MTIFTIPMMFLQCLIWQPQDEATTIRGFRFDQPVSVIADNGRLVTIENSTFMISMGCTSFEAHHGSMLTFGSGAVFQ